MNKSGQIGIDWGAQPLGQVSDSELARKLGVSSGAVRKARIKQSIPAFRDIPLDSRWSGWGMGVASDQEIASKAGLSRSMVSNIRRKMGLHGPQTIDWDKEPLGQVPDALLAKKYGIDPSIVGVARRNRHIPRGDLGWVTTEGVPANYPESCIDLWLHEQKVDHTFQVRLGPYIADWVLGPNTVVEYAGFEGHPKFGHAYHQRLIQKIEYYQKLGMVVQVIRPSELKGFMPVGLPCFRPRPKTCTVCNNPFESVHKHKAKGLCRPCYRKTT